MKARRGPGVEREEERSPLTVRIDQELRPIRFGFVVDPSDHASVLRAIEAATVTWGGRFCPLIPRFKWRRIWDDGSYIAPDAVMTGLVDAFEPDILVADDTGVAGRLGYPDGRVIHVEVLLGQHFVDRLGLPMAFVYKALYEREFRFEQRRPRRLVNALSQAGASPLLHAAMFGRFPEDDKAHREGFHSLGGTDEVVVASAFMRTLQGSYTPLRLTSEFLDDRVGPAALVFVLDPTRVIDIIDYWNLRARADPILSRGPWHLDGDGTGKSANTIGSGVTESTCGQFPRHAAAGRRGPWAATAAGSRRSGSPRDAIVDRSRARSGSRPPGS